jgi:hypothetical protein
MPSPDINTERRPHHSRRSDLPPKKGSELIPECDGKVDALEFEPPWRMALEL